MFAVSADHSCLLLLVLWSFAITPRFPQLSKGQFTRHFYLQRYSFFKKKYMRPTADFEPWHAEICHTAFSVPKPQALHIDENYKFLISISFHNMFHKTYYKVQKGSHHSLAKL